MAYTRGGAVRCDFCGRHGEGRPNDLDRAGWDWFTGRREETFHACAECLRRRRAEFDDLLRQSRHERP